MYQHVRCYPLGVDPNLGSRKVPSFPCSHEENDMQAAISEPLLEGRLSERPFGADSRAQRDQGCWGTAGITDGPHEEAQSTRSNQRNRESEGIVADLPVCRTVIVGWEESLFGEGGSMMDWRLSHLRAASSPFHFRSTT